MIQRLAAAALLAATLYAPPAHACPTPTPELLFHSCWGAAQADVHLLPDDPPTLPGEGSPGRWLAVTGAYTGKDARADGAPNPVGLFIDGGRLIQPNLARMDGVLVVGALSRSLALHHRERVRLGGKRFDLSKIEERRAFTDAAADAGISVIQSHLLIVDGRPDVRPTSNAPMFVRRLLFTDRDGYGVWESPRAMTLFEATRALEAAQGPDMALNLDMGSYDYCWMLADGALSSCGFLGRDDTGRLSNLLAFRLAP